MAGKKKRRIDARDRETLQKSVAAMREVADTIVGLDAVRKWALEGRVLLQEAIARLPDAVAQLADATELIESPNFNMPAFADLWFVASKSSVTYSALAEHLLKGPVSAPLLAHRIRRTQRALDRVVEQLPARKESSMRSKEPALDAVDALVQDSVTIEDSTARSKVPKVVIGLKGGKLTLMKKMVQPSIEGKPPRTLLAEAFNINDSGLHKRRVRRKKHPKE